MRRRANISSRWPSREGFGRRTGQATDFPSIILARRQVRRWNAVSTVHPRSYNQIGRMACECFIQDCARGTSQRDWLFSVGIEEEVRGQLEDDSIKHEAALLLLRRYLRRRCEELESGDFRYRLIEDRVKCAKSCADKLARKEKEAGDLYDAVEDLIGARVVVYNLSDRSLLAEAISNDDACPLSHLKLDEIDREDGYRAIHINGQFAYDERLSGEIQILTALQDGWAITSRAYLYRRDQQDERSLKIARAKSFGIHAVDLMLEDIRQRAGEVGVEAGAEGEPTQVAEIPPTEEDVEAKDTEPLAVDAAAIQIAFDQFDREDRDIAWLADFGTTHQRAQAGPCRFDRPITSRPNLGPG